MRKNRMDVTEFYDVIKGLVKISIDKARESLAWGEVNKAVNHVYDANSWVRYYQRTTGFEKSHQLVSSLREPIFDVERLISEKDSDSPALEPRLELKLIKPEMIRK